MARIPKYNLKWVGTEHPLNVELYMIKKGGQWKKKDGTLAGKGLDYHFREAIRICWPHIKFHDWLDLFIHNYLTHRTIVAFGPASSGKTCAAALCSLIDYYCYPSTTTTIICSTTKERLEDRIWGEMKSLHRMAKEKFSWLPGNLIEGRQRMVTDSRSVKDGRDFRNGIVGVPALVGGSYQGLGSFAGIKNARVRLVGDECFPAGTLIDTPYGQVPIESIKTGDSVWSAVGPSKVIAVSERFSSILFQIKMSDSRVMRCTPMHPFFTSEGWKKACELHEGHYILSTYESMSCLRGANKKIGKQQILQDLLPSSGRLPYLWETIPSETKMLDKAFLQSVLQHEIHAHSPSRDASEKNVSGSKAIPGKESRFYETGQRMEGRHPMDRRTEKGSFRKNEVAWNQASDSWRKRNRSDQSGTTTTLDVPYDDLELSHQNRAEKRERISHMLQSRCGIPGIEDSNRSGRVQSQQYGETKEGSEKGNFFTGAWVDSVEILKQTDPRFPNEDTNSSGCRVYNIQVEEHPSYSVNGFLVHNCHLLPRIFADAISNLDKNWDFKAVALGNPKETTDALGILGEPAAHLGGWDSAIDQVPKTKTWPIRRKDGVCIQFVGTDSPNLDGKLGIPLITQEQIDRDISFYGKDSLWFTMMDQGMMPRGQGSRRVITRQMCDKFHARDEPTWKKSNRKRVAGLDAAYRGVGGDRCVLIKMEFGEEGISEDNAPEDISGAIINQQFQARSERMILALTDVIIVPISALVPEMPEDQIVAYVRNACEQSSIPPENFYFDAGMRTSLVTAFSRLWSPRVNSIDFGGKPSESRLHHMDVMARDYYSKRVSELWFNVRHIIEAGQFRGMTEDVMMEGCSREWKMVAGNKIEVETKAEMKEKSGRSPDLFDALVCAVHGAIQMGFPIRKLSNKEQVQSDMRWKRQLKDKVKGLTHQLNYAA